MHSTTHGPPFSSTTVTISSLTGATSYTFRVRAVNAEGESYPTQVSVTPYDGPTPEPGAPTNLRATSGDRQVEIELGDSASRGFADHRLRIPIQDDKCPLRRKYMDLRFWDQRHRL